MSSVPAHLLVVTQHFAQARNRILPIPEYIEVEHVLDYWIEHGLDDHPLELENQIAAYVESRILAMAEFPEPQELLNKLNRVDIDCRDENSLNAIANSYRHIRMLFAAA